jgi:hypothetical protein
MSRSHGKVHLGLASLALLLSLAPAEAADRRLVERYHKIQRDSQEFFQRNPASAEAAWKLARAWYDIWDFSTNNTQRIEIARQGIAAARESIRLDPKPAAGYYYLGINLGCLADATRNLGGLKLVSEMEQSFKKAGELDATFDYAGPERCLGLLYRDAPGWPLSVGSRSKAQKRLERARDQAGAYPENQLNLLEAWLKWGERKKAAAELGTVGKVMAEARTRLTGDDWALSWADWDRRWSRLRRKLADPAPASPKPKEGR